MKFSHKLLFPVVFCNFFIISVCWRPPIIWKEGINWIQMVVGIGIPVDIKDATITIGSAAKAYYLLPTNTSYPSYTSIERAGGRSSLRYGIYNTIEDILKRYGANDGKSCLLRMICEYATKDIISNSLISKVINLIMKPSLTSDVAEHDIYHSAERLGSFKKNCSYLFPECKNDLTDTFFQELVF